MIVIQTIFIDNFVTCHDDKASSFQKFTKQYNIYMLFTYLYINISHSHPTFQSLASVTPLCSLLLPSSSLSQPTAVSKHDVRWRDKKKSEMFILADYKHLLSVVTTMQNCWQARFSEYRGGISCNFAVKYLMIIWALSALHVWCEPTECRPHGESL